MRKDKELIIRLKDEAIAGYDRVEKEFLTLEEGYLAQIDTPTKKRLMSRNKSHISQRPIKAKVNKITREIMKTYFSSDTLAEIEIKGDEKLTKIMQEHLDDATRRLAFYQEIRKSVENMLVYGTGISKVYWSDKKQNITLSQRSVKEVLIDPYAKSHFDAKYFVDRFYMSIADIKTNFKGKIPKNLNLENYQDKQPSFGGKDLGEYKRVEIIEVYRQKEDGWYLSVLLDDNFLRFDEPLSCSHPFIFWICYPQFVSLKETGAVRSLGGSYIEPMINLQKQLIVTRNQQMDAIYQQLNPRFFATRQSGLRDDDLITNHQKVPIYDLSGIKEIPTPNINQSMFDVNKIDEEIQEAGGLPKLTQGISSTTDPISATGMSLLNESGNATIDDIITSINENAFEPLVARVVKLIYARKTSSDFVGYDRSQNIMPIITVNAGMGSLTRGTKISNIDSMVNSLNPTIKLCMDIGASDKAKVYLNILDDLIIERCKLTGVKNIQKRIENAM